MPQTLEIAHGFSQEYAQQHFQQVDSLRMQYLFQRNLQELDWVVTELWQELEQAAFSPAAFELGFGDGKELPPIAMQYLFQRNLQELDWVVTELWQELEQAAFSPAAFELGFGDGKELPPIAIPNRAMQAVLRGFVDRVDVWSNGASQYYRVVDYKTGKKEFDYCDVFNGVGRAMQAVLRGFVDRVDVWSNGASQYYRVVDYKTGKKEFDYCDVFNGVGLQMLLYLFALRESGTDLLGQRPVPAGVQYFPARAPYISVDGRLDTQNLQMLLYLFALRESGTDLLGQRPVPAGVQYFPARAPYISVDGRLDTQKLDTNRRKNQKRQGLLLQDQAVLQAMEPGDTPQRMNYTVKKDGTLSGNV